MEIDRIILYSLLYRYMKRAYSNSYKNNNSIESKKKKIFLHTYILMKI